MGHGGRDRLLHLLLGSGEGGAEGGGHHLQHSADRREVTAPRRRRSGFVQDALQDAQTRNPSPVFPSQTPQQKKSGGGGRRVRVQRGPAEVCQRKGHFLRHVLRPGEQHRGASTRIHSRCCVSGHTLTRFPSSCQYEAKTRLENMSSSTAISSADLFGDPNDLKGETSVLRGGLPTSLAKVQSSRNFSKSLFRFFPRLTCETNPSGFGPSVVLRQGLFDPCSS